MLSRNGLAVALLATALCGVGASVAVFGHGAAVEARVHFGDREWAIRDLPLPVRLDPGKGETLDLELASTSEVERIALDVRVTGDVDVARGTPHPRRIVVASSLGRSGTEPPQQRPPRRASFSLGAHDQALSVWIAARGSDPVVISSIHLRKLRATRPLAGGTGTLALLAVLVAASVPLVWLLHRSVAASQWTLVGVAVAGLAAVQPVFCGVLLALLLAFYALGARLRAGGGGRRRDLLLTGLLAAVGFLIAFKYGQDALSQIFRTFGVGVLGLPLGLSYFVIRLIDTQLRWYRGELRDAGLREYLAYVLFPATIPAGPIETLDDFRRKRLPTIGREDVAYGLARILLGAAKKVILADFIFAQLLFGTRFALYDSVALAAGTPPFPLVAATLSASFLFAYLDFSAYSDIAIGLGRLYGYRIRENFDWPVFAQDLRQFWRSWHMSLSAWCMRNVYFPLFLWTRSAILPLYAVMIVIGVWHAASLSWFAWGLHHATGLAVLTVLERRRLLPTSAAWARWGRPVRVMVTLAFVVAGHAFVLFADFGTALRVYVAFARGLFLGWLG